MEALEVYEKLVESMEEQNKQTRIIIDRFEALQKRIEALEQERK